MAVVPSSLVAVETYPEPGQVWTPSAILRPDGSEPITVRTAWRTSVSRALSSAETRRAVRDRPAREIVYQAAGWRDNEALHIRQILADHTRAGTLLPLWSDGAVLTGSVSAASVTVPCVTTSRRFQVGARVALVRRGAPYLRIDDAYTLAVIDSLAADAITLTAVAGTSYAAGDLVVPIIEAALETGGGLAHAHADMAAATIHGGEIPGPAALEPLADEQTWPAAYATQGGLPILHLAGADGAVDARVESIAQIHAVGQTLIPTRAEGRPLASWRLRARFLDRSDAWDLLSLFDAARGRCHAFWFVPAVRDFTATAITSTTITVPAIGAERAWDDRPHIGVIKTDGTVLVRDVSGVVRGAGSDVVTVPTLGSITLAEVRAVTIAYKARFGSDEIVERWITPSVCEVEATLQELQDDASQAIADLVVQSSGNPGSAAAGGCIPAIPPLENLFSWFDAADDDVWAYNLVSGSNYLRGEDKVTAGRYASATANSWNSLESGTGMHRDETRNGRNIVTMTPVSANVSRQLNPSGSFAKSFTAGLTIYVVAAGGQPGLTVTSQCVFGGILVSGVGYYSGLFWSATPDAFKWRPAFNTVVTPSPVAGNFDWHVSKYVFDPVPAPDDHYYYRDGQLIDSLVQNLGSLTTGSNTGPMMCGGFGGGSCYFAEYLLYDLPITHGGAIDDEVMAYLTSKWGL